MPLSSSCGDAMTKSNLLFCPLLLLANLASAQSATRALSLDDVLAVARERSPAILAARRRVEGLQADRKSVIQPPGPELELSRGTGKSLDGTQSRTETGWSVSQGIEWPGRWRAKVKVADSTIKAGEAAVLATQADVMASVREQFFGILFAQREAGVIEEQAAAARDLLALVDKRVQVGEGRELDRIKASVESLRMERLLEAARSDVRVRVAILDRFLLGGLGASFHVEGRSALPKAIPPRETVLEQVVAASPLIAEARAKTATTTQALNVERQGRFPDLFASYQHADELDRVASSVSLGFRLPLWGFNSGPIRRAQAEREVATLEESLVSADVLARGERAYNEYSLAFAQDASYERDLLPAARKSLEIATFSYQQGELSLLELLDARRTYLDTVGAYNEVLFQFEAARAELERLIGGPINE